MSTIGIFDSGLGGLTVMREVAKALPFENLVYLGDTARVPYGEKSDATIIDYSLENARFLATHEIDLLVVACNSATVSALPSLKRTYRLPILGVVEPGVESALNATKTGRIGVIGTRRTVESQAYEKAICSVCPDAFVKSVACPLLVPLVEEGYIDHLATRAIADEYLAPLRDAKIDTLLLGCTHYPLLRPLLEEIMGPEVTVIDSAHACAQKVKEIVGETSSTAGLQTFFVSDDPEKFRRLGSHFLGSEISQVHLAVAHCTPIGAIS